MQMPVDERGNKELGRGQALAHLAQLALVLALGILVMSQPWPAAGQWRAVCGGFGVIYALQALPLPSLLLVSCSTHLHQCYDCIHLAHALLASCQHGMLPPGGIRQGFAEYSAAISR